MRKNKLQKEYKANRDRVKILFQTGYDFLISIENNSKSGFWLSTAQNAHLYYQDAFYCYMKLSLGTLIFSPEYNQRIETGTKDNSNLIFLAPVKHLVEKYNGFDTWASIEGMSNIVLKSKTPKEFFDDFAGLIMKVHK